LAEIEQKFRESKKSTHGMLDYLQVQWDKLFTPYSERLSVLGRLNSELHNLDQVYSALQLETTLLSGLQG